MEERERKHKEQKQQIAKLNRDLEQILDGAHFYCPCCTDALVTGVCALMSAATSELSRTATLQNPRQEPFFPATALADSSCTGVSSCHAIPFGNGFANSNFPQWFVVPSRLRTATGFWLGRERRQI